jgi:hypothetical protein
MKINKLVSTRSVSGFLTEWTTEGYLRWGRRCGIGAGSTRSWMSDWRYLWWKANKMSRMVVWGNWMGLNTDMELLSQPWWDGGALLWNYSHGSACKGATAKVEVLVDIDLGVQMHKYSSISQVRMWIFAPTLILHNVNVNTKKDYLHSHHVISM